MFLEVEKKLDTMIKTLEETNGILRKIEENLRVPDVVTWAKVLKEVQETKV
jgi:hypothetical protein